MVEEFLEWITVYPDHLEVSVAGAPPLNVLLDEVGLRRAAIVRVGDPKRTRTLSAHASQRSHRLGNGMNNLRIWKINSPTEPFVEEFGGTN